MVLRFLTFSQGALLRTERFRYSAPVDLATRMKQERERAGLTKTALAKPRYTVSYISQIESGKRKPSPEATAYFAERLGVSPSYLSAFPNTWEMTLFIS